MVDTEVHQLRHWRLGQPVKYKAREALELRSRVLLEERPVLNDSGQEIVCQSLSGQSLEVEVLAEFACGASKQAPTAVVEVGSVRPFRQGSPRALRRLHMSASSASRPGYCAVASPTFTILSATGRL